MAEEKQEDPGQELKAQSMKEFEERTKGKPTPTQEENDRAAMGEHVVEKEPDGAEPDPGGQPGGVLTDKQRRTKQETPAHAPGGYQTRQTGPTANPAPPPRRTSE